MNVIVAKDAGVCYGVKRALSQAREISAAARAVELGKPIYTLGDLIHNPRVVKELSDQGIRALDGVDDAEEGTVIVRSHGVAPEVIDALEEKGVNVIDLTCPFVVRAQKAASDLAALGGSVLVIGKAGHAEVVGLCGHAKGRAIVVRDADEIPENLVEPVGVLVQTTETREKLDRVVEALKERGIDPVVKNTICSATKTRQIAAAELADEVDAMVVIGGKNSSNTTHLYEICKDRCQRAYFIESVEEMRASWFLNCVNVGVTAGASTPNAHIREVVDYLESL